MERLKRAWGWVVGNANYFATFSTLLLAIAWLVGIVLVDRLKAEQSRLVEVIRLRDDANTRDAILVAQSGAGRQLTSLQNRLEEFIRVGREEGVSGRSGQSGDALSEEDWRQIQFAIEGVTWARHFRGDVTRTGRYATVVEGMLRLAPLSEEDESPTKNAIESVQSRNRQMIQERTQHEENLKELLGEYKISRTRVAPHQLHALLEELGRHSNESRRLLEGNLDDHNALLDAGATIQKRANSLRGRAKFWSDTWFIVAAVLTVVALILSIAAKFLEAKLKSLEGVGVDVDVLGPEES